MTDAFAAVTGLSRETRVVVGCGDEMAATLGAGVFTPGEVWSSGLTSLEEAKRLGFIGVCDTTDGRLPVCEAWMKENGKDFEQLTITTQRFFQGHPGPAITWKVFVVPPAK